MDRRVDPSATLREQNAERVWHDRVANGLRQVHHFALWISFEHERGQVSVFPQKQQILLV
jgi:hypothetical protein